MELVNAMNIISKNAYYCRLYIFRKTQDIAFLFKPMPAKYLLLMCNSVFFFATHRFV